MASKDSHLARIQTAREEEARTVAADAKKLREAQATSPGNIITSRTKFYAALAKARLDSWKKN